MTVNLDTGKATGTGGVEGFETVRGSEHDDRLVGDSGANKLVGGAGDDVLVSRGGADTLIGGDGDDTFRFRDGEGGDIVIIEDFTAGQDKIALGSKFGLEQGDLSESAFTIGTEAKDSSDRLIYDAKTGKLFFDADGAGGEDAVLIAKLKPGLDFDYDDVVIS
ncbi:hypothetical protein [Chenggangzhangella methanolivorans]|uniref:hypothetical protein n=1 Tax=Chenggangzhangella methanolivorans TaxID=1437009 RepID=UPI0021BD58F1|nr:hypothetical protein [Chenggangzhangella methanolivorans]